MKIIKCVKIKQCILNVYNILNIFKKKLMSKQKQKTEQTEQSLINPGDWLMWVKSDRVGDKLEVEDIDDQWINFTDGTRCNLSLASEYLASTTPDTTRLYRGNTFIGSNDHAKINEAITGQIDPSITVTAKQPKEEAKEIADPLVSMLKTLSKKNSANFPLEISVNIPSEAMFAVMTAEVEEEDLKEAIAKMILSQISIDRVQEEIKSNVNTFINKYYAK